MSMLIRIEARTVAYLSKMAAELSAEIRSEEDAERLDHISRELHNVWLKHHDVFADEEYIVKGWERK